jgi:hypothetical protein
LPEYLEMTEPIACRLDALTPAERTRQRALKQELERAVVERRETPNGYALVYPGDSDLPFKIVEWIGIERRCCPFVDFTLTWRAGEDRPSLELSGSPEVKTFIAQTFL